MSINRISFLISIACVLVFMFGCSSGGKIVTPDESSNNILDNLPVKGAINTDGMFNAIGIMGTYEFTLDTKTMKAELIPGRTSSIGESFVVSGLPFWTMAPCTDCLSFISMMPEDGYFKVTFSASHPFEKGDPTKPPSGLNRLDLDIFDLAMVIAPKPAPTDTYLLLNKDAYTGFCAETDGYTGDLANLTGDSTLCPFFLVIDNSLTGFSSNNKFEMGTKNAVFNVFFNEGGRFDLYMTMGYGASATFLGRLVPKYYNPEFNRKAAWKVNVIPPNGDDPPASGNTWDEQDDTTTYPVTVEVYDWQMGATVYSGPDFTLAQPTEIFEASDVDEVRLEIPGMHSALITTSLADSGTGAPDDPLVYTLDVANENLLSGGVYTGLVMVLDEREAKDPASATRDFLVDSPNGIDLNYHALLEFATYQTFPATVVGGCGPITGEITSPACPVTGVYDDASVSFTASASSDNGGDPVVLYEWDMDYDGITFDVDGTGQSVSLGPFDNPTCGTPDEQPYTYTVAVRGTDSCPTPNVTMFATCDVVVEYCEGAPVDPETDVARPVDDTWYDIGVMPDGFVYIAADVPATGNTDMTRTVVQYTNAGTDMTVINETTGMADVWDDGTDFDVPFNRIDVTDQGHVSNNPQQAGYAIFEIDGVNANAMLEGCYAVSCGNWVFGVDGMLDIWNQDSETTQPTAIGYERTNDCATDVDCVLFWDDSAPAPDYLTFVTSTQFYDFFSVVGVDGFDGSDNCVFFCSDTSVGYISISGGWFVNGVEPTELNSTGTLGTADGEFTGGLDIAVDSNDNILTLEDHTGTYRFQKFDSALTWQWTSPWIGPGNPLRMDFDKGDNKLYVLTDAGFSICSVQ